MIGKLQGVIDYIGNDYVILMVNGVGYKVYTPEILTQKSTVALWIETIVREDSIRLFGFSTVAGQTLFNQLTTVSGVGPGRNGNYVHNKNRNFDVCDCNRRRKNYRNCAWGW